MYQYRAERDRYHKERDEARTSLQGSQSHQMGVAHTLGKIESRSLVFIHGIC